MVELSSQLCLLEKADAWATWGEATKIDQRTRNRRGQLEAEKARLEARLDQSQRWAASCNVPKDRKSLAELGRECIEKLTRVLRWEESQRFRNLRQEWPYGPNEDHFAYEQSAGLVDVLWEVLRGLTGSDKPLQPPVSNVREAINAIDVLTAWANLLPKCVFHGNGRFELGEQQIKLTGNQANVLQSLVELRAAEKDELANHSGVPDAPRVLKGLCKKFPQLAPYIHNPGGKNQGGYSTTIIPADSEAPK